MKTIVNSFFLFLSTLALSLFIIEIFSRLILDNGMHYHLEMWKYAVRLKQISENPKLGHVSASCWSVEYNNPFSLAILKDGKNMIGQKLFALSPLKNKSIPVEIVSSHYVDPKGERVRS